MTLRTVLSATLIAASLAGMATDADAMRRGGRGDNAVSEQRNKLKAEWRRARAVGGYADPISAFLGLFDRDAPEAPSRERILAPSVNAKAWELAE